MKKYLSSFLLLLLIVFSCTPEVAEEKLYHSTDLHDELWKEDTTAREQVFVLKKDTVTTIVCEGGTKIIIPANAFVPEENSTDPVAGDVELTVLEVQQQAEMLRYHLSTQEEEGKLLESAGMVYMAAFAQGKKLRLQEGKEILLGFPKKKRFEGATLFSGTGADGGSLRWKKEDSHFDLKQTLLNTWFPKELHSSVRVITGEEQKVNSSPGAKSVEEGELPSPVVLMEDENVSGQIGLVEDYNSFHFFRSASLEWINCDRFVEEEETSLRLNVEGYPANALYYFVFDDINSLMVGYPKAGEPEEKSTVFDQIPQGRKGELIVIYHKGGEYFMAHGPVTVEDDLTIQLEPVKTEKKTITDFLKKFSRPVELTASR